MNLADYIDHTLLKTEATPQQIKKLCQEAKEYHFFSVCVNSSYVVLCRRILRNTPVKICSVIDIDGVVKLAHQNKVLVKAILETCLLTDSEKRLACRIAVEAGADRIGTSGGVNIVE